MDEKPLLEPEDVTLTDKNGKEWSYVLHSFPATVGQEIQAKLPASLIPKISEWDDFVKVRRRIMSYVGVRVGDKVILLETDALIDNHCPDSDTLNTLMGKMAVKNFSFFHDGRAWDFLEQITQLFLTKLSRMLALSSEQLSQAEGQPSTN